MKKIIGMALVCILALATAARADEPKPEWAHKEFRNGHLVFSVDYLNPWGYTVADASGLHFYNVELSQEWGISPVIVTNDSSPSSLLPAHYWATYPLYYTGLPMNYVLTLHNEGGHHYKNIDIRVYQEYLNPDGKPGAPIGSGGREDYMVPEIKGGETLTFNGSIAIPLTAQSGLDQTDVIVFKERQDHDANFGKSGKNHDDEVDDLGEIPCSDSHRGDSNGKVIFWDPQAGIWCPPGAKPNKPN